MSMESLVAKMKANYEEARNTAKTFSGEKVPEGKYEMKLHPVKFYEKPDSDKISLIRTFTVLSGELKGMAQTDFMNLGNAVGLSYAMQFIEMLGYSIPEEPQEWLDIIEAINEEEPFVIAEVVHNGDWVNIKVLELLEAEEAEEAEEDNSEEDNSEEEELALLKKIIKEENLKIRVTKKMTSEDVDKLITEKKKELAEAEEDNSEEEAKELTVESLIAFAEELGIDDLNPKSSLDEIKKELLDYAIDEDELEEKEIKFIKDNGLAEMLS